MKCYLLKILYYLIIPSFINFTFIKFIHTINQLSNKYLLFTYYSNLDILLKIFSYSNLFSEIK
jgi:hypothetical protein